MCDKIPFKKVEARVILKSKKKSRKQFRREKRMYYCNECNAWHLTKSDHLLENPVQSVRLKFKNVWNKLLNNE